MPRRVENTIVPRNPIARAAASRSGAGSHEPTPTAQRRQSRARVRELTSNWREELEFERALKTDIDEHQD